MWHSKLECKHFMLNPMNTIIGLNSGHRELLPSGFVVYRQSINAQAYNGGKHEQELLTEVNKTRWYDMQRYYNLDKQY
jgi:hypothetical protein